MANLFFPQLSTGAIAQFPFSKLRSVRTVQNLLPDGTWIVSPDPTSSRIVWNLRFNELSASEMQALQQFYAACSGPFGAFTFIDPADNMLPYSSDLTNSAWTLSPNVSVTSGLADPLGGASAFTITNIGQTDGTLGQTLAVPANYQYCLSVWVRSEISSSVSLSATGLTATATGSFVCGPTWTRVSLPVRLNDSGVSITAAIQTTAGQAVQVFGPQFEPQGDASTYRPTSSASAIYPNAHWASNQLLFSANGPSSFASSFSIESVL